MKRTTLLFVLAGLWGASIAQPNLDSLYAVWQDERQADSVRVSAFTKYIWEGYLYSDPDSAFLLAEALIAFAKEHDYPRAEVDAYNVKGSALMYQEEHARAIGYYRKCLEIYERTGNERGMGSILGNIGLIYSDQGDYPRAIEHFERSMLLCERAGRSKCVSNALNNLGNIYLFQGRPEKALEYYQRSYEMDRASGDARQEGLSLGNLGSAYRDLGDWDKALDHLQRSLNMLEPIGDKRGMSAALNNIGNIHSERGDLDLALKYYQRAMELHIEMGAKGKHAADLVKIAHVHQKQGDRRKAVQLCTEARSRAREAAALLEQKDACQCLYDNYKALGKGTEALEYLEQMRVLDDSLQADETAQKLEQMEFARQLFADSVARAEEARKLEAAHQEEIQRKNRTRNYLAVGGLVLLLVAIGLYSRSRYMRRSRDLISKERDRSESLLLNILPSEVAEELKEKGEASARDYADVSILFTDFQGFTQAAERLSAAELVAEINTCFKAFDAIVEKHGIEKIKTIGDAYMAAGGLPVPTADSAKRTVMTALDMQDFMKRHKAERAAAGKPYFEMRVGIHTGPVVAGIVGVKKFQYDIWGDTVNTASRMESSGEVGQVNISEATYSLVKDEPGLTFTPRGKVQAKGKGEMEMFFVLRSSKGA